MCSFLSQGRADGIMNCESVFVDSDSDVGTAVRKDCYNKCSDCGTAICEDCGVNCCGQPFCGVCYDFHATMRASGSLFRPTISLVRGRLVNPRRRFQAKSLALIATGYS